MSLCILAGGALTALSLSSFTLAWQHSVERIAWSERWQVGAMALTLVEARVKGSGAGMEPGPGATLRDGWWTWTPDTAPLRELALAASGATGGGWRLCHPGGCLTLGAAPGAPVVLRPCPTP